MGTGEQSGGQLCERVSLKLAEALCIEPTYLPGDYIGFSEDPEPFAARWRELLP